ncbi:ATP-dependent helicase HrpB [Microbulbifer hydrolyticus]|uniref:ATP-dependent helicase HrpB n=1 Tax=Microbulbifer hydrolyticus TaxID=48074 RepID=A0A6P1TC38_9GAMM|nr:ATP-dependent helicase HrpB [Microbulbifer hydrolyticus]MBB5210289.1 ATP-dependent helicase HrpB [Microbulbifer hydrolyticus]QHQ39213.1 ATP-dependent helicase HrpB [Microbulbifer hydrolyticus]
MPELPSLPIQDVLPELQDALTEHSNVVLQAPPGAGKTTAVPLALLDSPWLQNRKIIMLEPRRLAARSAAARMAELLGEPVGRTVGYQIRAERKSGPDTRILVVTEGILTRLLQSDPELADTALVIFDEFHERNLQGDLALALSLQSQEVLREDLKLLVMSATLDAGAVAGLLGDAPVITSEGRAYPVEIEYLSHREVPEDTRQLPALMSRKIRELVGSEEGSLLAFLPGVREIREVESNLREAFADRADIVVAPLYGDLSKQQQDSAIAPCPGGRRKIVLATNVAETSITIEGIRLVVDSGLMRESRFDPNTGMNRLVTTQISQSSATQRTGRAGRLCAGRSLRLWSESTQRGMAKKNAPEILLSDLAPVMLDLAQWGVTDVAELHWLDIPPPGPVAQARTLLQELGALDEDLRITAHGEAMLNLGTHPRLAHMMLCGNALGLAEQACLLAALLSERDIFRGEQRWDRDIHKRMEVLAGTQRSGTGRGAERHSDKGAVQRIRQQAKIWKAQLPARADITQARPDHMESTGVLLAHAYPDRIAKNRHDRGRRFLLSNGRGAHFSHDDELAHEEYLVVADLDGHGRDARIQLAARISSEALYEHFDDRIIRETAVRWDDNAGRAVASEQTRLEKLVLEEKPAQEISPELLSRALLDAIRQKGLRILPWNKESESLLERVRFLSGQADAFPDLLEQLSLPDWSESALLETLDEWLLPHLHGLNKLDQLKQLDLKSLLLAQLEWSTQQRIDELAPSHMEVPSGSRIAIQYGESPPVLPVRLQEMFGLAQTPAILNGRYPLMIHLLSPAQRPVQVTRDLASFWANTYHEVKKELRIKYQKHFWPDDPATAQATSKTKKRM